VGDYDNDGNPDVLLSGEDTGLRISLYRNLGAGRFRRVSEEVMPLSALDRTWGGGAVFGDYDNDGDLDLFVPEVGWVAPAASRNYLLRNDRGVFVDVTALSGLPQGLGTDNAIWLDYNRDGLLDLYVGSLAEGYPGLRNRLCRNNGDGSFTDVTAEAGLAVPFHPSLGGSNGGMAAADFDDDGWPDLFVAVWTAANRYFQNAGRGQFVEATTTDMADDSEVYGIAVGDVDGNGLLDLFVAGGGGGNGLPSYRSLMLLGLGQGAFVDALEAVGLGDLGSAHLLGAGSVDVDNDGDQDLLTGTFDRSLLYLNQGSGRFADATAQLGHLSHGFIVAFGDVDLDGSVDVVGSSGTYLNLGSDPHWLAVELAGRRSNRNGIGSRVVCIAGELRQTQQILGGRGNSEDELVAHFGVGAHRQIDSLEVHWPSGQVDRLGPLTVDQRVRVFEGNAGYQVVEPTRWVSLDTDSLLAGTRAGLRAVLRPALYEPGGQVTAVTADLRRLGGAQGVPLAALGDGSYRLAATVDVPAANGWLPIPVLVEQSSSLGSYWVRTESPPVVVIPRRDCQIFADALAGGWLLSRVSGVDTTRQTSAFAATGSAAWSVVATSASWSLTLAPATPFSLAGYRALRLAVHPGTAALTRLSVAVGGGAPVVLLPAPPGQPSFDPADPSWQVLEIPIELFSSGATISSVTLRGKHTGTIYVDDIRLLTAAPSTVPGTAIRAFQTGTVPQGFVLQQNYPNPFNSSTVIRYSVPAAGAVDLAVYDLLGQRVAQLVGGRRDAGDYATAWDGRDDQGQTVASGLYLYRLQAGRVQVTRRLALVQ
jgi:hypothetical protein